MSKSLKDQSRLNWESKLPNPTDEQIQVGCLQRIADATELMAKNYQSLIDERDQFKRYWLEERKKTEKLQLSIIAHKANYTRLKNKLEAMLRDGKSV